MLEDLLTTEIEANSGIPDELKLELPLQPSFPEVIDNTCRSAFRKCQTYWWYQNIFKIKPARPSIHLHAGAAFARGLEIARIAYYHDKLSPEDAVAKGVEALITAYGDFDAPPDSTKSCERMVMGLISYFERYPLNEDYLRPYEAPDGDLGVEFSFSLPIEDESGQPLLHPDTGNPLLYAGKFDMLAVPTPGSFPVPVDGSALFICDEKTTSQLGESWRNQWRLDSQFTGYVWGAKSFGFPVVGAVIRGVSFLKSKNDHAEVIIQRADWEIARWKRELVKDVQDMIWLYKSGQDSISMALDKGVCASYGGCAFSTLCESRNPENWIPLHYVKNLWNPLERAD